MPQAPFNYNPASLSVLQRLQGLSNVGSLGKRGLSVASGLDDLGPTDSELEDQQNADAERGERTTGYGFSDSKENLRADAMQKLKRTLMMGDITSKAKQAEAAAPKRIEGEYGLAKARIDTAGQSELRASEAAKNASEASKFTAEAGQANAGASLTQRLLANGGKSSDGGGASPLNGMRMSVNADGKPSFAAAPQTPAMIQRSIDALGDAHGKTQQALVDLETRYPGILDAAKQMDASKDSPGWGSFLTGGGPKYGNASDMAGAFNERLKYSQGLPSPFANLAQQTSFGNLEQMAGQLPGVRAFTTVLPLMKEHQSRWGKETPLATAQRLIHMNSIMGDSLSRWKNGDASDFEASGPGQ